MFKFLKSIIGIPTKEELAVRERIKDHFRVDMLDRLETSVSDAETVIGDMQNRNIVSLAFQADVDGLGKYLSSAASNLLASEKMSDAANDRMTQLGRMQDRIRAAIGKLVDAYNRLYVLNRSSVMADHKFFNAVDNIRRITDGLDCGKTYSATCANNIKRLEAIADEVISFSERVAQFEERTKDMSPGELGSERTNHGYGSRGYSDSIGAKAVGVAWDAVDTAAALSYGAGPRN